MAKAKGVKAADQREAQRAQPRRGKKPRSDIAAQPVLADTNRSRDGLLLVAAELFASHGYAAVSTTMIAKAAGLTQSMVHYYFGSKEALWKAAVDHIVERRGIVFGTVPHDLKDIDAVSRLKILVRRLFRANLQNPQFTRIILHEAVTISPRLEWLLDRHLMKGFDVIGIMLADALKDKTIKNLPFHNVSAIITAVAATVVSQGNVTHTTKGIDLNSEENADSLEDSIIEILFNGLCESRKRPAHS